MTKTRKQIEKEFENINRPLNLDIQKGRAAVVGEVRDWGGKKYKKQGNGKWVEISKSGKTKEEYRKLYEKNGRDYIDYGGGDKKQALVEKHRELSEKLSDKEFTDEELMGGAKESLKKHPQYTEKDYKYLKAKGWDDNEIKERWDEEHSQGVKPTTWEDDKYNKYSSTIKNNTEKFIPNEIEKASELKTKSDKEVSGHFDNKDLSSYDYKGWRASQILMDTIYKDFTPEEHEEAAQLLSDLSKTTKGVKNNERLDKLIRDHLTQSYGKKNGYPKGDFKPLFDYVEEKTAAFKYNRVEKSAEHQNHEKGDKVKFYHAGLGKDKTGKIVDYREKNGKIVYDIKVDGTTTTVEDVPQSDIGFKKSLEDHFNNINSELSFEKSDN